MSELLLELFSEEIPSRMQTRASEDLSNLIQDGLKKTGLEFETAQTFSGPRRLTLHITGLAASSPDIREERKGPRVGAPEKAIEGFLRGAGLKKIEEAEIVSDEKKGDYFVAVIKKPGQKTQDIIAEIVPEIVKKFPWPKSMKWGDGQLRWVRPLQSILCTFNGKPVKFDVEGIKSGNTTYGHRFMAPKPIKVKNFDDYNAKLRKAFVMLDAQERVDVILNEAKRLAKTKKLQLVEDTYLLNENAGLVEWPVVHMGRFDEDFLGVPQEVLTTSMKSHQKCFSLSKGGTLANNFILVSNIIANDGGKAVTNGNQRVIRARLSDAKFFWQQDLNVSLSDRLPKLEEITFHEKLGTQAERIARIKTLAGKIAPALNADIDKTNQAAELCKADLVTEMVGEFPELQGLMGRYYALAENLPNDVAQALEEHYKPQGPTDEVPTNPVSIAVGLADKLDTLVGFWAIDEKPTGSKDPYALRRAALGLIRLVIENKIHLPLKPTISTHRETFIQNWVGKPDAVVGHAPRSADSDVVRGLISTPVTALPDGETLATSLLGFFADRLKVYLRDKGARHDFVDAVFAVDKQHDILLIVKRVEALGNFLSTDDGANLLAGVKRAQNILKIEEKKDRRPHEGEPDSELMVEPQEKALAEAISNVSKLAASSIAREDFEGAMEALAELRAPVDRFFDHVTVNADDYDLRENRLKLLSQIRAATLHVADFSKVEG